MYLLPCSADENIICMANVFAIMCNTNFGSYVCQSVSTVWVYITQTITLIKLTVKLNISVDHFMYVQNQHSH